MHHEITVADLLAVLGILGGILLAGGGALASFAAGMASAPDNAMGRRGCSVAIAGLALLAGSIWSLLA